MIRNDSEFSGKWPVRTVVAVLVVLGLFIRVWGLWDFYLTPDEALVLQISSEPTVSEVLDAAMYHPHPPLRYIVLHFMLYFGDSPLFLRSIAFLPGAGLIPVFFLLGRRTVGTAAGLTMATMATFSHAAMMLSEVLRTYMLGTFFLSIGLYAFFAYLQEHRTRYLYLYSAAMTLALLSHYFAMLVVIPVGVVWLYRIFASQRFRIELYRAMLANLSVALVAAASYVIHLSSRNPYRWWINLDENRLVFQFPESLSGFALNGVRLCGYLFLPQNAMWLALLIVLGFAALWKTNRSDVTLIIVTTFAFNIVLTVAHKYPFGGTRQSFFLLPFVSMSVGTAVQFGWDRMRSWSNYTTNLNFSRWVSAHRGMVARVFVALFIAIFVQTSYGIAQRSFLRHQHGKGWGELPVENQDVEAAFNYLREHVKAGDILLADRQTMMYAEISAGRAPENLAKTMSKIRFDGLDFYHSNQDYSFSFGSEDMLWRSFEDLERLGVVGGDATIWITNLGWQYGKRVFGKQGCGPPMRTAWANGGASVYGFRGSEVADEVERRFGDGTADPNTDAGAVPKPKAN